LKEKRIPIDQLLIRLGFAEDLGKARVLILAGQVYADSRKVQKASERYFPRVPLEIKKGSAYVSRGGDKLAGALDFFRVKVQNKICLDIGASTGGFTDCLLQQGAKKIYAVDVGYGQFDWNLRQDPRVVLFEKSHFKHLECEKIPEKIDLLVMDVSFISLTQVLAHALEFLKKEGEMLILVKPQFELGPQEAQKGVVRSVALEEKAILKVSQKAESLGLKVSGVVKSVIRGPKGNQEYFLHLKNVLG